MRFPRRQGQPYRPDAPIPPNSCTTPKWDIFIQHTVGPCDEPLPPKPAPCFKPNQREVGLPLRGRNFCLPPTDPEDCC